MQKWTKEMFVCFMNKVVQVAKPSPIDMTISGGGQNLNLNRIGQIKELDRTLTSRGYYNLLIITQLTEVDRTLTS